MWYNKDDLKGALMKQIKKIAIGIVSIIMGCGMFIPTAFAEGNSYVAKEKGEIIIKYFSDNQQKAPIVGSKWRLYKVGTITYDNADETVDGLKITSEIEGLELTNETKSEDVLSKIEYTKISESKISVTGKDVNGKELVFYDAVTDDKGQITYGGLEQGVYLGIEVEAIKNHNRCTEFLISIPNTDETGSTSNISVTVEPKTVLAGSLTVTKKLEGNNTEAAKKWGMELTLPSGTYYYSTNKGQSGYVKNKDVIDIVGGEEITVYDLPSGTKYTVVEEKANKDGYRTTYEGQTGTIEYGKVAEAKVINYRNKAIVPVDPVRTGSGNNLIIFGTIGVVALAGIILLVTKKKEK